MNLNTTTVKVKRPSIRCKHISTANLNTTTVKVKPTKIKPLKNIILLKSLFFNEIFNFFQQTSETLKIRFLKNFKSLAGKY